MSQKHCTCTSKDDPICGEGHRKIVYAGLRFTTPAESRYALLFALNSCRMFVMGNPNLLVAVDHKPLIRIFNDRNLDEIKNPRLLKIREKTLMYKFHVIAIPGNKNHGADALSRLQRSETEIENPDDIKAAIIAAVSQTDQSDSNINR